MYPWDLITLLYANVTTLTVHNCFISHCMCFCLQEVRLGPVAMSNSSTMPSLSGKLLATSEPIILTQCAVQFCSDMYFCFIALAVWEWAAAS